MIAVAMRDKHGIDLRNAKRVEARKQLRRGLRRTRVDEHGGFTKAKNCRVCLADVDEKN